MKGGDDEDSVDDFDQTQAFERMPKPKPNIHGDHGSVDDQDRTMIAPRKHLEEITAELDLESSGVELIDQKPEEEDAATRIAPRAQMFSDHDRQSLLDDLIPASAAPEARLPPPPAVPQAAPPPVIAAPPASRPIAVASAPSSGIPPVVVSVMVLCAILSMTGIAALVFLKLRGFW